MSEFLLILVMVILAAAVGLFLAGMLSAAWENHKERRTLGYVTRPGWQTRAQREADEIARLEAEA